MLLQLYGGNIHKVQNWDEFEKVFTESFEISGLKIIEVPTERESNLTNASKFVELCFPGNKNGVRQGNIMNIVMEGCHLCC